MKTKFSTLDRRSFLRGVGGFALALPAFETFGEVASAAKKPASRKRLACFYLPNGVPMPLKEDPAYQDWSWFPHGTGEDFTLSKCLDPLEPLRDQLTVLSGLSHPAARNIHGHSNADQFLTGADTGGRGDYKNSPIVAEGPLQARSEYPRRVSRFGAQYRSQSREGLALDGYPASHCRCRSPESRHHAR